MKIGISRISIGLWSSQMSGKIFADDGNVDVVLGFVRSILKIAARRDFSSLCHWLARFCCRGCCRIFSLSLIVISALQLLIYCRFNLVYPDRVSSGLCYWRYIIWNLTINWLIQSWQLRSLKQFSNRLPLRWRGGGMQSVRSWAITSSDKGTKSAVEAPTHERVYRNQCHKINNKFECRWNR
jgi:hypothetical protein